MLKNYLKVLTKVLQRRLFFTAISLFGIAFTLMVLVVFSTVVDQLLAPDGPERLRPRLLTIDAFTQKSPNGRNVWTDKGAIDFFNRYVRPMKTPEMVAVHGPLETATTFQTGGKLVLRLKRTDAEFWRILQFEFLEGRPFNQDDMDQGRFVAVINERSRAKLFGTASAIGKSLRLDAQDYRIIGVVRDVPFLQNNAFAEVWTPLHTRGFKENPFQLMGSHRGIVLAKTRRDFARIKQELVEQLETVIHADPTEYNYLNTFADSRLEGMARTLMDIDYDQEAKIGKFLVLIAGILLLFMSLPAINLVNLNVSRIMERASEIGVRKAFGASSLDLVWQFLLENLFLTLLGGLLGMVGAFGILNLLETSGLIPYVSFQINWRVFGAGLLLIVFFGFVSGVFPAWKMSRMPPAYALKGGSR